MTLIARTWPYGTRRAARVLDRIQHRRLVTLIVEDDQREGHVISHAADTPGGVEGEKGDEGCIEFRQGGPTGGYWHFIKNGIA